MIDYILHFDQHLISLVNLYGVWAYALLALIVFCETGLVVAPFLPGDSLLFAAGAVLASTPDGMNVHALFLLLVAASVLGNALNYTIGRFIGPKIFHSHSSWYFNKKHLDRAHQFYEEYGGKTIIIGRFMPIIRTFVPFVAGIGTMSYRKFFLYNVVGAILWVGSLLYVSFWFGNLPLIKQHFSTIIIAIIIVSLLPTVIGIARTRR